MEGEGYGNDYNHDQGMGQPSPTSAVPTGHSGTAQPEKDLQPGTPDLMGAVPAPRKEGIAEKVKGRVLGGHRQRTSDGTYASLSPDTTPTRPGVYGDATQETETKPVGCLDKLLGRAGHHQSPGAVGAGVGNHPSSSPYGAGADEAVAPELGMSTDPTAAGNIAHNNNNQPGVARTSPGRHNKRTNGHSNVSASGAWPQPTSPIGRTNVQGGAALGDQQGNLQQGPRDDNVKKEGLMSKIMDKLHSPKGKPTPTTTPTY